MHTITYNPIRVEMYDMTAIVKSCGNFLIKKAANGNT